jgi:very-short-patch-repair endonuclease
MKSAMRQRAQDLRKNATDEEKLLWYRFLRTYPVQWNRQKHLGGYIVDFYCKCAMLVVELDGSQHFEKEAMEYDQVRTEYINAMHIQVLRFTNLQIHREFRQVCEEIDRVVQERLAESHS